MKVCRRTMEHRQTYTHGCADGIGRSSLSGNCSCKSCGHTVRRLKLAISDARMLHRHIHRRTSGPIQESRGSPICHVISRYYTTCEVVCTTRCTLLELAMSIPRLIILGNS